MKSYCKGIVVGGVGNIVSGEVMLEKDNRLIRYDGRGNVDVQEKFHGRQ